MKKLVKLYLNVMADKAVERAKERKKMEAKKRGMKAGTKRVTRSGSRWLTIADVCKRLGISRATFYRWRDAGQITAEQIGPHSVRIALSEVERFERSRPVAGIEWTAHG
jgi:excisionase family DNA binding protein